MTDSQDTQFDPSEQNVGEVVEHLEEHPEEAEAVADAEAEGKDRVTVAEAVEKAKKTKRTPKKGTYVLEAGDSPARVARKLLGRGSMAREVVAANPDVKWRPGVEINVPEVD